MTNQLPFTVQAKLIYLIESLVLPPENDPNAETTNGLLKEILNIIKPPIYEEKYSINTTGTTPILLIPPTINVRKKFYINNVSSSSSLYIDFSNNVNSTSNYFLKIPAEGIYVDDLYDQREVWGVRSGSSTSEVRIRYWE